MHVKARILPYPGKGPNRTEVLDNKVLWSEVWHDYNPIMYTAPSVLRKPVWADTDTTSQIKFNCVDGLVDRTSFEGIYDVIDGLPRNPHGRTGMIGRGLLGRWGPNHAADPIVTRWARDHNGQPLLIDHMRVLEFIAIQRRDSGQWAIPGGMVDAGETVSETLRKEFGEEALNMLEMDREEASRVREEVGKLLAQGKEIYKGYVDDPRNTDNAWMETVAMNFHCDGTALDSFNLQAGDDAVAVKWIKITPNLNLYANHREFLTLVAKMHNASC